MTPEEMKKLQAEHDKAMEAINAFNKAMNEGLDATKDYLGVAK